MSDSNREPTQAGKAVNRALSRWNNEGGAYTRLADRTRGSVTAEGAASSELITRSGFCFHVRPVRSADIAELAKLMGAVSDDDVRFRFPTNGQRTLERMSKVDHERTENFVVIDRSGLMVATAMLASGASGKAAEVAIAVHADYRHHGIGWALLDYLAGYAAQHGLTSLVSTQSRDDHTVIDLESEMGFVASPYPGDPSRVLLTKACAPSAPFEA